MEDHPPPVLPEGNLDSALSAGLNIINEGAKSAKKDDTTNGVSTWDQSQPRWKYLLEKNDASTIWKAINWKGKVSENNIVQPEDRQFKVHFEDLLNTDQRNSEDTDLTDSPYIPVLDNPFNLIEMNSVKRFKDGEKLYGNMSRTI